MDLNKKITSLRVTNLKMIAEKQGKILSYINNLSLNANSSDIIGFLGADEETKSLIFKLLTHNFDDLKAYQGYIEFKSTENYHLTHQNHLFSKNVAYGFDHTFLNKQLDVNGFHYIRNYLNESNLVNVLKNDFINTWNNSYEDFKVYLNNRASFHFFDLQKSNEKILKSIITFFRDMDIKNINILEPTQLSALIEEIYRMLRKLIDSFQKHEYSLIVLVENIHRKYNLGESFLNKKAYLDARNAFNLIERKYQNKYDWNKEKRVVIDKYFQDIRNKRDVIKQEITEILRKTKYDLIQENRYYKRQIIHSTKISSFLHHYKNYAVNKKLIKFLKSKFKPFSWLKYEHLNILNEEINHIINVISTEATLINLKITKKQLKKTINKIINFHFNIKINYFDDVIKREKENLRSSLTIDDLYKNTNIYSQFNRERITLDDYKNALDNFLEIQHDYRWNVATIENKLKRETAKNIQNAKVLRKDNRKLFLEILSKINSLCKAFNIDNLETTDTSKLINFDAKLVNKIKIVKNIIHILKKLSQDFIDLINLFNDNKWNNERIIQIFLSKSIVYHTFKNANIPFEKMEFPINSLTLDERINLEKAKIFINNPSLILVGNNINLLTISKQYEILDDLNKYTLQNRGIAIYFLKDYKLANQVTNYVYIINNSKVIEEGRTTQVMENPINPLIKKELGIFDKKTEENYFEYFNYLDNYENLFKYQIDTHHYVWCTSFELNRWVDKTNLKNESLKQQLFLEQPTSSGKTKKIISKEKFEETTIIEISRDFINKIGEQKMEKSFNHKIVEDQRNEKWKKAKFFMTHDEAKRPFTIILPPPNVTGKLHIGHALDTYIQDTIIRYKKLQGYDVMWVPGKDHAGIATQAVVEKKLAERGISKYDLGREKFIEEVWKWKEEFSNNITSQWDKLGLALDFENERFTFDTEANEAVLKVFVDLYNAGLIYRDNKPINWDPKLQTALSNIEVVSRETNQKIYYIKYPIKDSDQHLVIATTRIETLFSDVAVAINPKDERIKELKNKTIIHPLTKKELPVVLSETIDPTFGSGVMKVSAHAIDDIEIIKKNNLEIIECIDKNGILNEQAMEFKGLDRLSARESIYIKLENEGYIDKVEQTKSAVGYSERSGEAIEILVQPQWFVKMNFLSQKLLKHFESVDGVKFIPERFAKDLTRWMTDTYDWTISRQIWWGHRIPAWYKDDEVKVQIENPGEGWVQDNDVLDTWFSSALSPFVFLGWPQTDIKIKRYFPTDVLVTAYDIIFFWVARMYFQSLYFMNEKPFKEVLIHGIVRDAEGRKMSKSLGNGIDPIQVIDEQGSDVLRMSLIFNCAPGQDINFSDDKIQTARLFINKFWNIARYISSLPIDTKDEINFKKLDYYDLWILAKFQLFKQSISNCMDKYEFNLIFKYVQDFIVNDLSSWYLEFIKFKNNNKLVHWLFREILILMHPFMPFVTDYLFEYIFHEELLEASSLQFEVVDEEVANKIQSIINIITTLRKYREEKHISKAEKLYFTYKNIDLTQTDIDIIKKLTNYEIQDNNDFMIQLPNDISINIKMSDEQKEQEIKDLLKLIAETKKEIEFNKKMLDNQSFISKAPKATISEKQQKLAMHTSNLEAYEKELAIKQNRK